MRFFKREQPATPDEAIREFWTWWADARTRIAASIEDETLGERVNEISDHVHRIDKGLAWELSKGIEAEHAFVVSPEGDPAMRPKALAWLATAPPRDALWEFYSSRQPGPLGMLSFDGLEVDLNEFRAIAGWDESRERVNVHLWHPTLAAAKSDGRQRVAYLFLDNLLGEDAVERWIGTVDVLDDQTGGRTPEELRAEVDRQAATATGDSWILATLTDGRGGNSLISVNATIKPIDYPLCLFHLVVTVDRGLEQLAGSDESADLNTAEDRLVEAIQRDQKAAHIGHVTERRRRLIHFMCEDADRASATARAWADTYRHFGPHVNVTADPRWEFRRDLGL
jgi:hypothetical protein